MLSVSWLSFVLMQIIHVNLTQESPKPLEVGRTLDLTYSVKWTQTNVTFARRFDVYLDYPFFEHQVKLEREYFPLLLVPCLALFSIEKATFKHWFRSFSHLHFLLSLESSMYHLFVCRSIGSQFLTHS